MARALHLVCELNCGVITDLHIDVKTENSRAAEKQMTVSLKKINDAFWA